VVHGVLLPLHHVDELVQEGLELLRRPPSPPESTRQGLDPIGRRSLEPFGLHCCGEICNTYSVGEPTSGSAPPATTVFAQGGATHV
jgi:hypothetical protein